MFNDELILVSYEVSPDGIGNQKKKKTEKAVLCEVESATRSQFYNYGDSELRPEYNARINECDYENETEAVFKGQQYVVDRTYQIDRDLIELTLVRRVQR